LSIDRANLTPELNAAVSEFAGWPYKVASGRAVDHDGRKTDLFSSIVYVARQTIAADNFNAIPADTVAAVIDAHESLNLDMLRASYARVTQAKRLKKAPAPRTGAPITTVTLGIIFAQRAALPLEHLADEPGARQQDSAAPPSARSVNPDLAPEPFRSGPGWWRCT
jgi:hypothetical protein